MSVSGRIFCQNIVPNPSFEDGMVPMGYGAAKGIIGWGDFSGNSSDYFNGSASGISMRFRISNCGVPDNEMGHQQARTGNAYVGLAYSNEIIQCKLNQELIKDSIYDLEFFANLADSSNYAIWRLGAYFSTDPITSKNDFDYSQVYLAKPQILNDSLNYINDTVNWIKISGFYKAKGSEKFLSIGCFSRFDYDKKILYPSKSPRRYYYIDDVSLIPISLNSFSNFTKDTTICLNNLLFENGEISIKEEANSELEIIVKILKNKPTLFIEVSGHTDNIGDYNFNNRLSIERAKAVYNYFIEKGIDPKRVTYKGYGSTKPIFPNNCKENRAKNRRVELKITKK